MRGGPHGSERQHQFGRRRAEVRLCGCVVFFVVRPLRWMANGGGGGKIRV